MAQGREALWDSGHDESVEVNQRALIDKVLARYSGEFTVFRELLQNSDDAQSKAVEIHFETQAFIDKRNGKQMPPELPVQGRSVLPDLKTTHVQQWTFKNNGIIFRSEDWDRLKKIAEGNPDEEKIGAFGVGFYSLFSVTEEPFVTSGGQWMGFYWKDKKDQLFARRGKLPEPQNNLWTTFEMTLREGTPIPPAFDFTRFLASSITFMSHLSEVSVFFDDKRLSRLTKSSGMPRELSLPRGLKTSSLTGMMNVEALKSTSLHIKAEVMRWVYSTGTEKPKPPSAVRPTKPQGGFFSSLFSAMGSQTPSRIATPLPEPTKLEVDLLSSSETSVALSIFSADIVVSLDSKMAAELHRSTKKNPPRKLKYELIYTSKDEYDASVKEDEGQPFAAGSVFQGLRADLEGSGSARVFIGHSTGQTTGLGGHMATRFIPTVERESIDLVFARDRHVANWNRELLYVGGYLSRAAYELEMSNIKQLWEGALSSTGSTDPTDELQVWLRNRALHALKFFTFHPSTPSMEVSALLEAAFFSCGTNLPFSLISSAGVKPANMVRLPDPVFATFLKQLPVLSSEVLNGARPMVNSLQNRGMIKAITFEDVLNELRNRPLSVVELIACLSWWIDLSQKSDNKNLPQIRNSLLEAAVLTIGESGTPNERIFPLSVVKKIINNRGMGAHIPVDGSMPEFLLPPAISSSIPAAQLTTAFPWTEFSIPDWIKHITSTSEDVEHDLNKSAPWAERVLLVLARQQVWPSLSAEARTSIVTMLQGFTCIPTSAGLKMPNQAYFSNANVFKDLPVVTLASGTPIRGTLERLLEALGVRKHVDLQVVFDRMIKTGDWTVSDLVKYLVAIKSTLTLDEVNRLKETAAFLSESPSGQSLPEGTRPPRSKAKQLYEPLDIFRQLGLPVLDWGTQIKWRGSSEEAKFLFGLGLKRLPPLEQIISLCASEDVQVRTVALKYFLDHIASPEYGEYDPTKFADVPFVPSTRGMGTPKQVFVNAEWANMGFQTIRVDLRNEALTKLKIRENPPTALIISVLEKTPPKDEDQARVWFQTLAGRLAEFTASDLQKLSAFPMVPTRAKLNVAYPSKSVSAGETSTFKWLPPSQCYFGGDSRAQFHSQLFVFVDFGTLANGFLSACGTKREPSVEEIALILLSDPHKFYELAQGRDNFLTELRNIAINSRFITSNTLTRMKRAPVLLASQRKLLRSMTVAKSSNSNTDQDEEDWDLQYDLKSPSQIVIADDANAYQLFGDSIFCAPQEDILEDFYGQLGSRRLSSLVIEEYNPTTELKNSNVASNLRALILERLPLFLHEHTHRKTKVSLEWLSKPENFSEKTFGKIVVNKTLHLGHGEKYERAQETSACAKRVGYGGPIRLWVAGNGQVDYYEVATSLCRVLFEAPKANDALLFMTILSTDLRSLKRRGYNVDRILRQQKAARDEAEKAARARNLEQISAAIDRERGLVPSVVDPLLSTPSSSTTALPPASNNGGEGEIAEGLAPVPPAKDGGRGRQASTLLQNIKRKMGGSETSGVPPPMGTRRQELVQQGKPAQAQGLGPDQGQGRQLGQEGSTPGGRPRLGDPGQGQRSGTGAVSSQANISTNIDMAISACKQEDRHLLRNRQEMKQVKESLNEGYCDISGRHDDLDFVGAIGEIKVYSSREVQNARQVLAAKRPALLRFTQLVKPLARIYRLPAALHIFYDLSGEAIAFNRDGGIFLNLRFYEAWHDEDVRNGNFNQAYISWYFTLAHEIAHNLVQPHNSEHEFYFSAICEKYMVEFAGLLGNGVGGQEQGIPMV